MSALFRYVIVPSVLATGYFASGSLNDATFPSLNGAVFQSVYSKFESYVSPRQAGAVDPVDPAAVARIDEDLDYSIARRVGSPAGWRAFLANHGRGAHAESARAEIDRLLAEETDAPLDARASVGATPGETAPSAVASGAPDEICKRDEERLARLRSRPSIEEAARLADELACQSLWPQLLSLIETIASAPPPPAEKAASDSPEVAQSASETASAPTPVSATDVKAHADSASAPEANNSRANAEPADVTSASVTEAAAPRPAEQAIRVSPAEAKVADEATPVPLPASETNVADPTASTGASEANTSPADSKAPSGISPSASMTEVSPPSQAREATRDPDADAKPASEATPSPAPAKDVATPLASATLSDSNASPSDIESPGEALPSAPAMQVAAHPPTVGAIEDPHTDSGKAIEAAPSPLPALGTDVDAPALSVTGAKASPGNTQAASSAPSAAQAAPSSPAEAVAQDQRVDAKAATQVAMLAPDDACKRDAERLAWLRSNPSGDEARRFASEMGCEKLRPQLSRLMESFGFSTPTPAAPIPLPTSRSVSAAGGESDCVVDRDTLDTLRAQPLAETAQQFWRNLRCERLRPQVRLLLESLDLAADPSGDCRQEAEELNRIRANRDDKEARRFAHNLTCDALKPQAARLLESLTE